MGSVKSIVERNRNIFANNSITVIVINTAYKKYKNNTKVDIFFNLLYFIYRSFGKSLGFTSFIISYTFSKTSSICGFEK